MCCVHVLSQDCLLATVRGRQNNCPFRTSSRKWFLNPTGMKPIPHDFCRECNADLLNPTGTKPIPHDFCRECNAELWLLLEADVTFQTHFLFYLCFVLAIFLPLLVKLRPWSYEAETSGRRSLMGPTTTLHHSPQCLEICGFCRKKKKKSVVLFYQSIKAFGKLYVHLERGPSLCPGNGQSETFVVFGVLSRMVLVRGS